MKLKNILKQIIVESKWDYRFVDKEEFEDALGELATLDLEDDQVIIPRFNGKTDPYIFYITAWRAGDIYVHIRNRNGIPESGAFELFLLNDDETIGFMRGTKKDKIISFNLAFVLPEERGKGIGSAIYEYFLNDGYIIKSDTEISDGTYTIYDRLTYDGFKPIVFEDGTVGLIKDN